ncbi:MAG TPA: PQQ-binding-like beta-propeller repeat protein [Pyrinomonadaceae bacterium]|nr:PQQ-binding-like beta-propeller repeat protein [Pyrinomonadaceae bacterium]
MKPLELMTGGTPQVISPQPSIKKSKAIKKSYRFADRLWCHVLALMFSCSFLLGLNGQTSSPTTVPVSIEWVAQAGVARYRLQISTDKNFADVRFDTLVTGRQYTVRNLEPGRYYWRVAPSDSETGQFRQPVSFEVTPEVAKAEVPVQRAVANIISNPGWLAATGEIKNPLAARLRLGSATDFVGVNTEGTVYALDGQSGVALWAVRYQLDPVAGQAKRRERQFIPLVFATPEGGSRVVAAFDGGVRLLNGATGRELWRTDLPGRIATGVVAGAGRGPHLFLIGDNLEKLFVLDVASGHLEAQTKLKAEAVGPPVVLPNKDLPVLLIPLKDGAVALHDTDGNQVRVIKLGADITTPPLLVNTANRWLMLIGTKKGLLAIDATELKVLGPIVADTAHYPVGGLAVADINGDKSPEVVMTTNGGRVVSATISDGVTQWSTEVPNEAAAAAFADLNGDGFTDVILPGKEVFAIALSGANGSVIWQSSERVGGVKTRVGPRSLAIARTGDGRLLIVGNDPFSAGVRGLQVQGPLVKSHIQ